MNKTKNILLVDDDEFILRMYEDVLSAAGFSVHTVSRAADALDLLIKNPGKFHLVITDIRMVEMDGWEFLRIVRDNLKISEIDLPVIVVSAYDSTEMERKALQNQANKWFVKPIKPLSLLVDAAKTWTGHMESNVDA